MPRKVLRTLKKGKLSSGFKKEWFGKAYNKKIEEIWKWETICTKCISVFRTLRQRGRTLFIPFRLRDNIPRRKDTRGQVLKNVVLIRISVGIVQILSFINSKAFPSKSNIFLLGGRFPPLSLRGKHLCLRASHGRNKIFWIQDWF